MAQMNAGTEEETKSLTNWTKEPTLLELKQDLSDAQSTHDAQKTKINTWLENLNITGKAKMAASTTNSTMQPKLIRKQAEWRYAALSEPFLSTEDIFNVRPVTWEDRDAAKQNELVLNHQINNQIDKIKFVDEYVRTAVDEGTVIIRTGWEFAEEEIEVEVPEVTYRVNPGTADLHAQLEQMRVESPSQYQTDVPDELKQAHEMTMQDGQPYEPVVLNTVLQKQMKTIYNRPTLEICDFRNITFDPTCLGDMEKASFLVYSFESSKSALKKDGKYKNLDKIQLDTNSILGTPDHISSNVTQTFNFNDDARKKIVVHEYWGYWDIHGNGTVEAIVAAWVGNTLIRLELNPYPDKKIPFVVVQYLPVRKSLYGEPDGALLDDNQKVVGALTRGMIDVMAKSANGQTGVHKGFLDVANRRKFESGKDYEFNAGVPPEAGVYFHKMAEIPQSAPLLLGMQYQEAESMTGVKAFSQGISGSSLGDVAAGVRGALDAASKRELGILHRLSNGIVKVGRKLISMNAEFLSDEEVIRITNDEFITVRKDDLAGSFDLKISISTAEEDNHKAEELGFMLQTMGPNMDPDLSKMILGDVARLKKMPDLAQKIEAYQPAPNPLAEAQQKLEIAKLEAEVAEIQARTAQLQAAAQLNMAKIGTEQVKQGNMQSDTDLMNLDYVEQESGVKQERDLEKQGAQAKAQAQTKIVEHNLSLEKGKQDFLGKYVIEKEKAKVKATAS